MAAPSAAALPPRFGDSEKGASRTRHPPALLETVLRAEWGGLTTRLDAWYTALATQRLRRARALPGRDTGLVLGAYGVLLDLAPAAAATAADPADLPPNPPPR